MTIFVSFFVAGNSGTVPHESISMRIIEHTLPDSIGVFGSWVALEDSELETLDVNSLIDHLISRLRAVSSGNSDAGAYHALMVGILELPLLTARNLEIRWSIRLLTSSVSSSE